MNREPPATGVVVQAQSVGRDALLSLSLLQAKAALCLVEQGRGHSD